MSVRFEKTRGKVWKIEDKEKYAIVTLSTSRKVKDTKEYKNTYWFASFMNDAYEKIIELHEGDEISINGRISKEEYVNSSGEKLYPKNYQMVVYNWSVWNWDEVNPSGSKTKGNDYPVVEDDESDDNIPF